MSEAWLKAFADAYFAEDAEQIQKFLAASFERDLLTVTVAKENDGWKVYDYGLEG